VKKEETNPNLKDSKEIESTSSFLKVWHNNLPYSKNWNKNTTLDTKKFRMKKSKKL
jgi:hypothetical protein